MFDLYTTTAADINPAHVTDGALIKKLLTRLAGARMDQLRVKAKPGCKSCYGRGYVGIQANAPVPCNCTQKR